MARLFPDDIPYLEETNKRKKKLFYTENPLELIADLLKILKNIWTQFRFTIRLYKAHQYLTIEFYSLLKEFQKDFMPSGTCSSNTYSNTTLLMK